MNSAQKAIGPISLVLLLAGFLGTFALTFFMPVTELIPAQVLPEPRGSGESPVRSQPLMNELAKAGFQLVMMLPQQEMANDDAKEFAKEAASKQDKTALLAEWEAKIIKENGKDYGQEIINNLEQTLGGRDKVADIVHLVQTNKNYCYYAYALFLGLAMFAASIAIQAVGRYDSEEKTIVPVKK